MNGDQGNKQNQEFKSLRWPTMHQSIKYINKGLYATEDLQPNTLLLFASTSGIISPSTLPSFISQLSHLGSVQKIALYILILKNMKSNELNFNNWILSQTHGFVAFSQKLIKCSNDIQLLIQYAAAKNHYACLGKKVYEDQLALKMLKKFIDIPNFTQFLHMFIKASEFANTRAFGYTEDYLLIPGLDYLNYDPSKDSNNITFVTFDTFQQISKSFQKQQQQAHQKANSKLLQSQQDQNSCSQQEDSLEKTKTYVGVYNRRILKAGEQLLFNYGDLSNRSLLISYGYAIRNNPNDFVIIYVSKYHSDKIITFSQIERGTVKFKIRCEKICKKLLIFWNNLYKNEKDESKIVQILISQLESRRPPSMTEQDRKNMRNQTGYQYLLIYQEEQLKIYENQIELLRKLVKQSFINN